MNSPEDNASGSRGKEDAMLVSALDGKLSHRLHCRDSALDTNLGHKVPKFSLNMKNYCSIHLRLLHNLNEDRRHDIFMLNPECHLKFLEENLNFLSRKPTRCNDFKISSSKSSTYSVETSQNVSSLPDNCLPSLTFTSLSEGRVSQLKTVERKLDNGGCMDTVLYDGSKIKISNVSLQKRPVDKPFLATPPIVKIKEKYSSNNDRYRESQPNVNLKPLNTDKTADGHKSKTDSDNQFEFTVAGEKIVSFVCSPPASRRSRIKENEINFICDSDDESTVSSSKGSSETASNTSSRSSYSKYNKSKDTPPLREHVIKTNILLWHPPSTSRTAAAPTESKAILSRSAYNRQNKQKPIENCINFFGSINSLYAVANTNNRSVKSSHNQETVMFRETALRGCYDIETLLKEAKLTPPEVEKEVSQTREAIFSAVRLQRSNDTVVCDSVQSIVDICNSWIKLNAHFERKDFKHFLETNDVDLAIFGDFAQWQCMSRIFVDKLINALKKVSLGKSSKISRQHDMFSTKGSEMASVHSNVEFRRDTNPSNNLLVVPNLNNSLTAVESQGKRWKQRRFLSEKTDSEKVLITSNKPCRSIFAVDNSVHNSILGNNINTETAFGQGDNGLNPTRDLSKGNLLFSSKNCQLAQGDVSYTHHRDSGFFDKNISVSNIKCCTARGETNICPVPTENELCTPVNNLVDMPLNNFFPMNIQQAVPTVPPIYNSPHCIVNTNQFQPSFNHSLAKPNPIHCIDSDAGENFVQSSYMKPGHYAPPQKPASFQKAVNNTIPIEDIPAVGIPFLYSAPFTSSQHQQKSLECSNGLPQIQMSKEFNKNNNSEITWKAALSMAGPFRDTMMAERNDDFPNLKLSETVSMKSHFLLSDGNSQTSSTSSDSFKVLSDNERSDSYSCMNFPVPDTKTTNWLVGPINKLSQENDKLLGCNFQEENKLFQIEQAEGSDFIEETNKVECNEYKESYFSSNFETNPFFGSIGDDSSCNKSDDVLNPFFKSETGYLQKKPKKNKKVRDDFSYFDRKNATHFNNPEKMVFTRNMSNKVCGQLEDILNCIWNTKVSTLVDDDIKSEKEMAKLEVKIRSPLYLQAMRCKLSNHSYDTLDQALNDFQQYFADLRNKSKGDKLCLAAVSALERMFLGLVEKYFGLSCQSQQSQSGMTPSTKVRRPKKTQRRI